MLEEEGRHPYQEARPRQATGWDDGWNHLGLEVASQRRPWPLNDINEPLHLGVGEVGLVGEDVAFAHPLEIDLIVRGDHGQRPLHPKVNGLAEFVPYIATQGLHTAPRISAASRSRLNSATASDISFSSATFWSMVWAAVSRSFLSSGKRTEALSHD
jgi:hypothetical protein